MYQSIGSHIRNMFRSHCRNALYSSEICCQLHNKQYIWLKWSLDVDLIIWLNEKQHQYKGDVLSQQSDKFGKTY